MKQIFLNALMFDAGAETKTGGFTEQEKGELKSALNELKSSLKSEAMAEVAETLKKHQDTINESIKKFGDTLTQKSEADKENQKALNDVLVKVKELQEKGSRESAEKGSRSLGRAIAEALHDPETIERLRSVRKGDRAKIQLKGRIDLSSRNEAVTSKFTNMDEIDVKAMTTTGSVTGDPVITYDSRQALTPAQRVNFRDLIPTVYSQTGTFVHYAEGAVTKTGTGVQATENTTKTTFDFAFTEVKTVNKYVNGITQFSKQMMKNMPFLQNTLPRLLQREFFKTENRYFWDRYATVNASGGASAVTSETDDVKQVMDWFTSLLDNDYMPSFGILRYTALNRLNKLLYTNGYYQGSGGVQSRPDGSVAIMGMPVIPVTWIPSFDKFATFDADYMERIEVEGLTLEFFEQDSDNVQKNMITARIECFEEINPMLAAATLIGDFGNSATS